MQIYTPSAAHLSQVTSRVTVRGARLSLHGFTHHEQSQSRFAALNGA